MASTNAIRAKFLDYFVRQGHEEVSSGPLVPRNDPTLMFTNAGMVQFKNVFTGVDQRAYNRAATSQKVVRAGGKHNDLENVGYTARHHTFFEMLGNFSFGDYFKDGAIEYAWRMMTEEYGLDPTKLLVTVYSEDEEAASLWRRIAGLPEERIIRIPTSDNFWSMGDTGPCGPCSEIFYDHGPSVPGGPPGSADEDGDRFIEVWNLVFMQYEQVTPDKRVDLPRPSIDTGMGLERIAAVLQGRHDNYDIDLMRALIEASAEATDGAPDGPHAVSHRVIADHLRATSFLIADGVMPSNDGRGYVLRRIMRRAMRHAHILGADEPVIYKLVPALVQQMGDHFSELKRAQALITDNIRQEENRFRSMLDRGLKLLGEESQRLGEGGVLPGEVAFKLYDTYGFPLDLTQDVLRGENKTVDTAGFQEKYKQRQAESRKSWTGSGEAATDALWYDLRERVGATEFLGYETGEAEGVVVAMLADGVEIDSAEAGQDVQIITNQTPFYGESGGQVGDTGSLFSAKGAVVEVTDTQKRVGDLWVHIGQVREGPLALGEAVEMRVDLVRRRRVRANHSATHLLHEALRRQLGEHVTQRGSLVAPDRLRFDISQPTPLNDDDILAVQHEVNARIRENAPVETRLMTPEEAIAAGAMALFGEKYGDTVRVVSMGMDGNKAYSMELCGGIHVDRTGDIGAFALVDEGAVSSGVRRIEALTGKAAVDHLAERERLLSQAAAAIRVAPIDLPGRIATLLDERRRLEREVTDLRRKLAAGGGASGGPRTRTVAGVTYADRLLDGVSPKDLKPMADEIKKQIGSGVVALVASGDDKASIVVGVTEDLTDRFNAVDLVRVGSAALGGKGGGGRPDMAQAGGSDASQGQAALDAIAEAMAQAT